MNNFVPDSTIDLTQRLVSISSISPDQSEVQGLLRERLLHLGFHVQEMEFHGSKNLWAKKGDKSPLLVFSGHTDVVPAGDENKWTSPPFTGVAREGKIFGRGASDMKGSLAAMITATESFITQNGNRELPFSIGFLITGDEELGGPSAESFLEYLTNHGQQIDYCLVGEPTSESRLGDTIKIGRRGSLGFTLKFLGKQGHVAYPQSGENALHRSFEPLMILARERWDEGSKHFQSTSLQMTTLHAGIAGNVIPDEATVTANFRFSPPTTPDILKNRVEQILSQFPGLSYHIAWELHGEPFLTQAGTLSDLVRRAIKETLGVEANLSTAGGISDARHFAKRGVQVVELGPSNHSIHQIDENVSVRELQELSRVYANILLNIEKMV